MTTMEEMIQNVSGRYHNKMKKICQPLVDYFGISSFTYAKVKNDGNLFLLGNHPKWMEHYCSEKLYLKQPHFRNPSNFKSGISLAKQIENEEYRQLSNIASDKFNVNFGVGLLNQKGDELEIIGIDLKTSNIAHDMMIINEIKLIRFFISKFINENKFLLDLAEENQVNINDLIDSTNFQGTDTTVLENQRKHFLKEMGVNIPKLSTKEMEVLKLLLNGQTAGQMGDILHLSPRTIEHYIERMKDKFDCFSKSELIIKVRELEAIGQFDISFTNRI